MANGEHLTRAARHAAERGRERNAQRKANHAGGDAIQAIQQRILEEDRWYGREEATAEEEAYWAELKPALRSATPPEQLELTEADEREAA